MLNAEKYKDDILKYYNNIGVFAVDSDNEIAKCDDMVCRECLFSGDTCREKMLEWLLSEYKEPVGLTVDEYSFLHSLGHGYLARQPSGDIHFYDVVPKKSDGIWYGYSLFNVQLFNELKDSFKFIKVDDEKPCDVKEILSNCDILD